MNVKVKKQLKPFLNINNRTEFSLPIKAKEYYKILINNKSPLMKNTGQTYFLKDQSGNTSILLELKIKRLKR